MHDALLISEVFSGILDCLAEDTVRHLGTFYTEDNWRARGALAVLARTCRAFSEPALDALWHRLDSLEPFVQCLPTKVSYGDIVDGEALLLFNEEDWNMMSRYAPRVQELILQHDPPSVKILQSWQWFRTTPPLPNLRNLVWHYEDCTAIGSIRLLLSPSLVHLDAWLDSSDHSSVMRLLQCYHTLCPNLKSLYFGHLSRFPYVKAAFERAIFRSPNLETLTCDSIDEAALIHIAGSRFLKKFTATLLDYRPDNLRRLAGCGPLDHPPFENLRALDLRVENLSSIIPYLKAHYQPFEEVSFDFYMLPTPGEFHEFFTALSSATRRGTLRRIKLYSIGKKYRSFRQLINFRALSPLMAFNLQKFDVNIDCPVSFNDDELALLVQAWPELETFYFNRYIHWEYDLPTLQTPTLRGLLLLLSQCPRLRNLGVGVDARDIPSLTEDESLIRNMAITSLELANSPIEEPVARVTQFLLEHFPSLIARPALVYFNEQPSYGHMWGVVRRQIEKINGRSSSSEGSDGEMEFV